MPRGLASYQPVLVRLHIGAIHIWAIPVRAVKPISISEVRIMVALHGKAVPEAPCLGRLRCGNADEEGNRRKGAENEFHRFLLLPLREGKRCRIINNPGEPNRSIA